MWICSKLITFGCYFIRFTARSKIRSFSDSTMAIAIGEFYHVEVLSTRLADTANSHTLSNLPTMYVGNLIPRLSAVIHMRMPVVPYQILRLSPYRRNLIKTKHRIAFHPHPTIIYCQWYDSSKFHCIIIHGLLCNMNIVLCES